MTAGYGHPTSAEQGCALSFATSAVLVLAFLLGGGTQQGFWSDAIVQLASLPLLALVFLSPTLMPIPRRVFLLLFLLVALPLAQLIPLPPMLWTALPGREEVARAYDAASIALPWLPISLAPSMTRRSAFSLLPPIAVFLGTVCLADRARRKLVLLLLAVAFVSVLLGLLQMMGGQESPLRFYAITNASRAVGFFANVNHNAAFLFCAIPFAAAFGIGVRDRPGLALGVALLLGFIFMGLAIIHSRAGLILAVIAGLSCIPLILSTSSGISRRRLLGVVIGGNAIALLVAFQFGFVSLAQRVQGEDISADLRWPVSSIALSAAQANLPFGTGFGAFVPVYQTVEPRTLLFDRYVNRAHNDWLEMALEGGILTIAGLVIFFVWFGHSGFQVWRRPQIAGDPSDRALVRAASIVVVLLMLHSTVDYPLRTTAMMVVFALACALLTTPNDTKTRPIRASERTNLLLRHRES